MSSEVTVRIDGQSFKVVAGTSLAAALLMFGRVEFRRDTTGAPRAPLCGMGTCFECRVTVDGATGTRACLVPVVDGMIVETGR